MKKKNFKLEYFSIKKKDSWKSHIISKKKYLSRKKILNKKIAKLIFVLKSKKYKVNSFVRSCYLKRLEKMYDELELLNIMYRYHKQEYKVKEKRALNKKSMFKHSFG